MEIKVKDFINQVEADEITKIVLDKIEVNEIGELKDNFMASLFADFENAFSKGKVVQAVQPIEMVDESIEIVLETGVINLPFANIKRVDNFFDVEDTVPLLTNLIVISPSLNASGLFIRSYSGTSNLKNETSKIVADTLLSIKQIQENLKKNEDSNLQES
ncbi:hypothetical protein QS460_03165 [Liquorilactobacillus mali]|mgnify:CR=1 FL=1|uniref:hypothetical protein n=1 Tax=Liquorilactobacillus mali TaxID=1618 RepID=UPI00264FBDDA|nr:hypothetical protein [Liquorilactobacillus mali]MDN7144925.1 hypothetical protein [Liquorilactobacillus mali]